MSPYIVIPIIVVALVLTLAVIYIILIKPNRNRGGFELFKNTKYAHRGLHSESVAENSLTAFRLATEAGYGIEFDVHAAKCGTAVVFHDATLNRMTGVDAKIADLTAEELGKIKLGNTEDCIPTLKELLELVDGRVPLLVDLKQNPGESGVAKSAYELLKDYKGEFIVESFNPIMLREFAELMPEVRRGILGDKFTKYKGLKFRALSQLMLNCICKPDFVAYNHEHGRFFPIKLQRLLFKTPLVAWTVRSLEEEEIAVKNGFDTVIFENYIPQK
ncbi:MAG: hypothetical protein IIX96_02270 [Clostridia bacterium]|nr:hypothetical protein [Clostridia bacterium]